MKVLVFIDWYLPGFRAGGPVQSCANLVAHLGEEIQFSVVTRDTDYTSETPYPNVTPNTWNRLSDGTRVYYVSNDELQPSTIRRILDEEQYDAVYLNGIYSYCFTQQPLRALRRSPKPVIVAVRGMLAPSALAIKKKKKKLYLALAKLTGMFSNVRFHATTEKEADEVRRVFGDDVMVAVAPNLPKKSGTSIAPLHTKKRGQLRLVSVARIAPEKNTLFALQVLQHVKVDTEMDFYGPVYDQDYAAECRRAAEQLPKNVRVNFHASVPPEEVPALLRDYDALFLPSRGENFGHVILEAFQAGLPVIISDQTPWRNLEAQQLGVDLPLDDPKVFAAAIAKFAEMDEAEFRNWSEQAAAFAAAYLDDETVLQASRDLFFRTLQQKAQGDG